MLYKLLSLHVLIEGVLKMRWGGIVKSGGGGLNASTGYTYTDPRQFPGFKGAIIISKASEYEAEPMVMNCPGADRR